MSPTGKWKRPRILEVGQYYFQCSDTSFKLAVQCIAGWSTHAPHTSQQQKIAHDLARIHISYYNDDFKRTKGMYRQRSQRAWGHTAHRGWARLLLNRAR